MISLIVPFRGFFVNVKVKTNIIIMVAEYAVVFRKNINSL